MTMTVNGHPVAREHKAEQVSVIICTYTMRRWTWLCAAIASMRQQTVVPTQIIVVVDHNTVMAHRLRQEIKGITVVENAGGQGLSAARNTGVRVATGDIIAFLDDDAEAEPDWLETQLSLYTDAGVIAVGGRIVPLWQAGRPAHLPHELDWLVGCSYRGLPRVASAVRNAIGASMSFRREVFARAGLFDERIGRSGFPGGCEETDLCVRATAALPGTRVVYQPASVVRHHVPADRGRWGYMIARGWGEGVSKARMTRVPRAGGLLRPERRYLTRVLPRAVLRGLLPGHADSPAASAAIVAVTASTAAGYLTTTVGDLLPRGIRGASMRHDGRTA